MPIQAAYRRCRHSCIALPAEGLESLPQQQQAHEEQHSGEAPCCAAMGAILLCVTVVILQHSK